MTAINITAVNVLDNPTLFVNPFQFEIQYECLQDLQHGEGLNHHQQGPYPTRVACKHAALSVIAYRLPRVPIKLIFGASGHLSHDIRTVQCPSTPLPCGPRRCYVVRTGDEAVFFRTHNDAY